MQQYLLMPNHFIIRGSEQYFVAGRWLYSLMTNVGLKPLIWHIWSSLRVRHGTKANILHNVGNNENSQPFREQIELKEKTRIYYHGNVSLITSVLQSKDTFQMNPYRPYRRFQLARFQFLGIITITTTTTKRQHGESSCQSPGKKNKRGQDRLPYPVATTPPGLACKRATVN